MAYQRKKWVDGEVITDDKLNNIEEGVSQGINDAGIAKTAANEAMEESKKKAQINHADPETTYGKGDGKNYGHVKLSDSLDSDNGVDDGVAATPAAVKAVYEYAKNAANEEGAVPTNHADPEPVYGAGDANNYGHVKLSDSVDDQSGEDSGTAATPSAVKAAYDKANEANKSASEAKEAADGKAPKDHKATDTTYGAGDASNYGHVKLSASTTSTSGTTSGIAATPSAVKAVADQVAGKLDKAGGTMAGALIAQNNTNYTTGQVRNIFLIADGASLPSGANGDICLVYTP